MLASDLLWLKYRGGVKKGLRRRTEFASVAQPTARILASRHRNPEPRASEEKTTTRQGTGRYRLEVINVEPGIQASSKKQTG